jgi:hypothetical protein
MGVRLHPTLPHSHTLAPPFWPFVDKTYEKRK